MSGGGASGKGSLKSFPVPNVMEDEERDEVDEEIHRDEDVSIKASGMGPVGWCMLAHRTGLEQQPPCRSCHPATHSLRSTACLLGWSHPPIRRSPSRPATCATSRLPPHSACRRAHCSSRSSLTQVGRWASHGGNAVSITHPGGALGFSWWECCIDGRRLLGCSMAGLW